MDTPSKFLRPNVDVSFELDEVFALLKTPAHEREKIKASINTETVSLELELFLSIFSGHLL